MKKLIPTIYLLAIYLTYSNTALAYYYSDPDRYSSEQYRKDIKSYLDKQTQRQDEQDFENKIQKITNNLNTNNSNAPSQFDIDQMQKKFDEAKKNYDDTSVQIKQIQDIISQQNQMIIEQKKLKDDENKKYDVYLKLVKVDNSVKTQVKKVQRPTILDEQNSNQMPDILNDSPAPTVIIKSEVSVEKPLYKRTFDRIRSFLVWW